jgi:hypothetical protein
MSSCFLFVTFRDQADKKERVVVAPLLSFSTGWNRQDNSRYRPVYNLKLKNLARPSSWTVVDVKEWLTEEGVAEAVVKRFEEAGIDGEALMEMSMDDLPALVGEAKLGERLKLKSKLQKLAQLNAAYDEDSRLDSSGLNVMLSQSSVTTLMMNMIVTGHKLPEVAVVHFCATERNGYGQQAAFKTPDAYLGQAFDVLQMRNVAVNSFQESGSGDSSPMVSVSFYCDNLDMQIHQKGIKDFSALGPALMGLQFGITDKAKAKEMAVRPSLFCGRFIC